MLEVRRIVKEYLETIMGRTVGPSAPGYTCNVCGAFFEHGKAYGYVCSRYDCPTGARCL